KVLIIISVKQISKRFANFLKVTCLEHHISLQKFPYNNFIIIQTTTNHYTINPFSKNSNIFKLHIFPTLLKNNIQFEIINNQISFNRNSYYQIAKSRMIFDSIEP
ncbi:hypothetical protein IMG5_073380, partial [Ichthyophthirius multifiliis]